jgi:hypothetical protein
MPTALSAILALDLGCGPMQSTKRALDRRCWRHFLIPGTGIAFAAIALLGDQLELQHKGPLQRREIVV